MPPPIRVFESFEKTIHSKGLKLSAAGPSSCAEILICQLYVHPFWRCNGNHQISSRFDQKSTQFCRLIPVFLIKLRKFMKLYILCQFTLLNFFKKSGKIQNGGSNRKKRYHLVVQAQGYLINVQIYQFRSVENQEGEYQFRNISCSKFQTGLVLASQLFDLVLPELFSTRSSKRKKLTYSGRCALRHLNWGQQIFQLSITGLKIPSGEADQLSIYKHNQEIELRSTEKQFQLVVRVGLSAARLEPAVSRFQPLGYSASLPAYFPLLLKIVVSVQMAQVRLQTSNNKKL